MKQVRSRDGTTIAYDRLGGGGGGPPVILVDGAFCSRAFGPMPKLAPLLARDFTVFVNDRRARGDSGEDRKSTRLNSSHTVISYAVFCLKKKKGEEERRSA